LSKLMIDTFGKPADDALVARAKHGDIEAYAELVSSVQVRIYRTIFGMTRSHEDTDDLSQETFLYAYRALPHFRQKSSFYTWVYRIAVNLTLNFLKKKHREKNREEFEEGISVFDRAERIAHSPEGDSLKKELNQKLEEAIGTLPLAYRAAFNLVVFQGMSHGRAAEVLGCSENTVSWRMHKARKMLQGRLKEYI
jgi:RNA polymerase sigma-70 factor (ECF subfamily)